VKFGCKRKATPEQIDHARAQIERGRRREDVAALFKVDRATLYWALSNEP
jgi:DNA-binding phage protein